MRYASMSPNLAASHGHAPPVRGALGALSPAARGNQAMLRRLQAKLTVGAVNDPLEHEADAVADQVMRMPDPAFASRGSPLRISRKCAACEEEAKQTVRTKREGARISEGEAPATVDDVLRSPGEPLDTATRAFFEPRFVADFSDARIHRDDQATRSAQDVGARAYTVGKHLVFAPGAYAPTEDAGRRLIAHELSHVVQQGQNRAAGIQRDTPAPQASGAPAAGAAGAVAGAAAGRPAGGLFWGAYQQIGYNVWQGEGQRHDVWKFVGGNVGKSFDGQNTCAARVSYGLNYGGAPIAHYNGRDSFRNDPSTKFEGKAGDGKNYIVGAPAMDAYFGTNYGAADSHLATRQDAVAFESTLKADECAVFAGAHHSGLIKGSAYADPYLIGSRDVTSGPDPGGVLFKDGVDVWKLA
jgi:hypothetical protein